MQPNLAGLEIFSLKSQMVVNLGRFLVQILPFYVGIRRQLTALEALLQALARNMSGQPPTNYPVSWQIELQYMTGIDVLSLQSI
jgi:hypothetical protein